MEKMLPEAWSATAAWIALAISIVGTIVSPIINTIMSNRHQIKLRKLDIKQRAVEQYNNHRIETIDAFMSAAGKCLTYSEADSVQNLGESFPCIYQYVSESYWKTLDDFYELLCKYDWIEARKMYPDIIHTLTAILKEPPPSTL